MHTPRLNATAKAALLAIVGSAAGAVGVNAATFTAGDLLVGFSSTANSTVVFYNIGSSVSFRDGGVSGTIATLGSELVSAYGSDWFTSGTVSWGVVGVRNAADPTPVVGTAPAVVNGDPSASIYVSRSAVSAGSSTAFSGYTENNLISASNAARGILDIGASTFASTTSTFGGGLGVTTTTASTQWDEQVSNAAADFGLFVGGIEDNLNGGSAFLDIYRILARTDQAGTTILNGNTTIGQGSYIGTLAIDGAGAISVAASAIPEPSSAAALAGVFALSLVATRRRKTRQA